MISHNTAGRNWNLYTSQQETALGDRLLGKCIDPPEDNAVVQRRKGHVSWKLDGEGFPLFVKKYYPRNIGNQFGYLGRTTRADREIEAIAALTDSGFSVPVLLASSERRKMGLWQDTILVFRYYPQFKNLRQLDWAVQGVAELVDMLAEEIARLHESGIVHGDLHGGNILVARKSGEWHCLFTDFDKVSLSSAADDGVIDDLARLNGFVDCEMAQRNVFFTRYYQSRGISDSDELRRRVCQRTEELWRNYNRKHGGDIRKYPCAEQ